MHYESFYTEHCPSSSRWQVLSEGPTDGEQTDPCATAGILLVLYLFAQHILTVCIYANQTVYGYCTSETVTLLFSPSLQNPGPPGMIINLIIKHLLPTAPALSFPLSLSLSLLAPPGTPPQEIEIGGEPEREGGTQEEPEGGVERERERSVANPKGLTSHCWILLH